ncbi:MAG: hypothetical protein O7G31_14445, partial [Calditrichaeota bacterium]|nr:hypothetical protein [Calditrichota bacterium]
MALRTKWCEMVIATILISLFLSVSVPAQERGAFRPENSSKVTSSLLNINDLSIWVRADGVSALNPYYENQNALPWGLVYPR